MNAGLESPAQSSLRRKSCLDLMRDVQRSLRKATNKDAVAVPDSAARDRP